VITIAYLLAVAYFGFRKGEDGRAIPSHLSLLLLSPPSPSLPSPFPFPSFPSLSPSLPSP